MGPDLMERFRAQSARFETNIITETVSRLDLSQRPFKYWREGNETADNEYETADTIIIATGASAKRLHLAGEEKYWIPSLWKYNLIKGALAHIHLPNHPSRTATIPYVLLHSPSPPSPICGNTADIAQPDISIVPSQCIS